MKPTLQRGVPFTSLPALSTTGTGLACAVPESHSRFVFEVIGVGTVSGGTILIEEAHDAEYTGTWDTLLSITAADISGGEVGMYRVDPAVVPPELIIRALRARISSDITGGGSVTVRIVGS